MGIYDNQYNATVEVLKSPREMRIFDAFCRVVLEEKNYLTGNWETVETIPDIHVLRSKKADVYSAKKIVIYENLKMGRRMVAMQIPWTLNLLSILLKTIVVGDKHVKNK